MNLEYLRSLREFAQSRPANANAVSVVAAAQGVSKVITEITVTNTSANTTAYSIYFDRDGTTYDQTTAIAYQVSLPPLSFEVINVALPLDRRSAGNIAIQTSVANDLTFHVKGVDL